MRFLSQTTAKVQRWIFHDHAFQERATEEALPADALDAVWNRQLGSVQKAFFRPVGQGMELGFSG